MDVNNRLFGFFKTILFVFCILNSWTLAQARPQNVEENYKSFCQTCHSKALTGGLGPSLVDSTWLHGKSVSSVFNIIKNGVPNSGMPAFGKTLSDGQINGLIGYIRERGMAAREEDISREAPLGHINSSTLYQVAGHEFRLKTFTSVPGELWAITFLPNGQALATVKSGEIWLLGGKSNVQVKQGLPKAMNSGQGGYFDIEIDPDYAKNQFIYLSYSEQSTKGSMTRVDRGRLKQTPEGPEWEYSKTIFSAPSSYHIQTKHHFGGRIAFKDNAIFVSVGERGQRPHAQDLSVPNGKIHHLTMEGEPSKDNPFLKDSSAFHSIWSYGHRNPQGLAVHPITGDLWEAEHGPRGGDEINVIQRGNNYGWPEITYGMNYDGTAMTDKTQQAGMEQPKHYWVPSIAVSGIEFYTGSRFPKWKNHLLVASLAKEELHLLKINGDQVSSDELLLKGIGRMREVSNGPDGYPYFTALSRDGESTTVYRLEPSESN